MSKTNTRATKKNQHGFKLTGDFGQFKVYTHTKNGLQLLHYPIPDTGVVTTNITYKVGSVDEQRGESGLAHMLEHMLFKPTKQDLKQKIANGAAMEFERSTGAVLNANTSYDRTTYYFSFPKQHTDTVLQLEANRMQDVVLSDKEFLPERGNVLSEFDMYNGDPYFALEVAMRCATFQSHAYDHEIIGFREDIEDYTTEKLQRFYDQYYQPNNATLMLLGDITKGEALQSAERYFGQKKNKVATIERQTAREPKIVGPRSVTITRPGTTNILAFGFVHAAFPQKDWFITELVLRVLVGGPESVLHKALVDAGHVSSLTHYVFTTAQPNMGLLFMRLADNVTHEQVTKLFFAELTKLSPKQITKLVEKEKVKLETEELFGRVSSLGLADELTQYAAADAFDAFSKTKTIIKTVTAKDVERMAKQLFSKETLTTGYYQSV